MTVSAVSRPHPASSVASPSVPAFRLVAGAVPSGAAPVLDAHQRAVVEHRGGPLLVLAGPGTGKTTTLVEAVVDRIAGGLRPEQVLVLTFSRKAAGELRDRITTRLGRTATTAAAATFHSFCYGLLRAEESADLSAHPLRLLPGPEQELAVRELLDGGVVEGTARWPEELAAALGRRGFAKEVRAVLARARELGLEPEQLLRVAETVGRPDWSAAAHFLGEYLDVLDTRGVIDYAELVHRAALLAERDDVRTALRSRYRVVFVDEYQDTDAAQERLLRAVAGDGRDLVAFGDPDQSIYAFRGADVRGLLDFPARFCAVDGRPAAVRVLRASRRAGPALLAASRVLARRMPLSGLPAGEVRAHRALLATPRAAEQGVEVLTFPTVGAQGEHVADVLRRAHLEDGMPWGDMAVLVRSGVRSVPPVRRALIAAGVPVEVAGDELPLHREPAVAPLLAALRCAADPAALTAETARELLVGPLGGADVGDLRRLGRALRAEERAAAGPSPAGSSPAGSIIAPGSGSGPARGRDAARSSAELIREAVADPRVLVALDEQVTVPARRVAGLLAEARAVLDGDGSPEEALWRAWVATPWPHRLERTAWRGGPAGRAADRDLDAVCALFELAGKVEGWGARGVRNFLAELESQQISGDTLAEQPLRGAAVRLLTAHRSKGLQWPLVVVTDVQEGGWPDLRQRGSVLQPDRIGRDGLVEPLSRAALLAEERRLFYVAVTRASARLVVTAVRSPRDDGEQPSRFLGELGVEPVHVADRPRRPLSVAGLIAELRATAVDPAASTGLRAAATARLATLAAATDSAGFGLVPAAHPRHWWGLSDQTGNEVPIRDPAEPVRMSGSAVAEIHACPLRWFLRRESHADGARSVELGFGSVLHALADDVANGRVEPTVAAVTARLDTVWDQLGFEAPWRSAQQKQEAQAALERFLTWHTATAERGRELVATELSFSVRLRAEAHDVVVRGSMDRVERDEKGRVQVIDFKTGKRKTPPADLAAHPQLGVYQLAVRAGAVPDPVDPVECGGAECGGAELVQLRVDDAGMPLVQAQASLPGPAETSGSSWVEHLVAEAARRVLAEEFVPHSGGGSCERCEYRRCCPAWPEGRQVVD